MIAFVATWELIVSVSWATMFLESDRFMGGDTPWLIHFFNALIRYGPWILLAPLLLVLFHCFPFRRGFPLYLPVLHLLAGALLGSFRWGIEYLLDSQLGFPLIPLSPGVVMLELIHYGTFLIGYTCIDYYRRYRDRENRSNRLEAELTRARLIVLKMQLNPHFLFNTLHAISSFVYDEPRVADRMISRLSDLLRLTLENSDSQVVPLKEELDFTEKYLEIEQVRFGDRIAVKMEIDPVTLDAYVPNLILQPLIENAVKHGIAKKAGGGVITIRAGKEMDKLAIEVCDNGKGLSKDAEKGACGLGLANTRTRLAHLYGAEADLAVVSLGEGGFSVRLFLPFDRSAEEDESGNG